MLFIFNLPLKFLPIYKCVLFLFQPLYGFTTGGPRQFKKAAGHKDLFYVDDKDVEFKDVRNY